MSETSEIEEIYVAGRKEFKSPDGNSYAPGEHVPDANLFPNLSLLLRRDRLRPATRAVAKAVTQEPKPPKKVAKKMTGARK